MHNMVCSFTFKTVSTDWELGKTEYSQFQVDIQYNVVGNKATKNTINKDNIQLSQKKVKMTIFLGFTVYRIFIVSTRDVKISGIQYSSTRNRYSRVLGRHLNILKKSMTRDYDYHYSVDYLLKDKINTKFAFQPNI